MTENKVDLKQETKMNETGVEFEEALNKIGFGKFNILIWLACGGSLMSVIIETQGMMFVIPAAQCDLQLSVLQKGLLSSIGFLGVFTSSLIWGFIADTKGRRRTILVSLFVGFATTLVSSLIAQTELFIFMRFINGIFVSGSSAVIYAYVGEFQNNQQRPRIISWTSAFVAVANVVLPSFAWLILPQKWSYPLPEIGLTLKPWRLLVVLYGIPGLIFGIIVYIMPESPKFLLSQGKHRESITVLNTMYSFNTGKKDLGINKLTLNEVNPNYGKKNIFTLMWKQISAIFAKVYVVKTILVCLLQAGIFFSTNGVLMWYPEILNGLQTFYDNQPDNAVELCSYVDYLKVPANNVTSEQVLQLECTETIDPKIYQIGITVGVAYIGCYIVMGALINVMGKKQLLVGTLAICTVAGIMAQILHGIIAVEVLTGAFLMGGSAVGIVVAILVDLYPTKFRAIALAVSLMVGRIGAVIGINVTGQLFYSACGYFFYVFTIVHIVLGLITYVLPTKSENLIQVVA